jgi:hypothetical protein
MSEFQLDPVVINTGEEDDEERRRREAAMRALGDLSAFDAADAAPPVATQAPARAPDLSAFDRAREPVAREHAPPPTQASLLDQGLPPPPGARPVPGVVERRLGRQQGQAQALGDQYRAGTLPGVAQPGQARVVRDEQGREQGRIYPPGMLPPPVRGEARFSPGAPPDSRVPPPVGQTAPPPAQPPGGALPPNAIGALRGAEGGRPSYMGQAGEAPSREQVRQLIAARSQSPAQRLSVPMGETPAGQQLRALEGQVSSGKKPAGNAPPDYTGADVADAFRRPLHALAAGLRAYAGRPSQPFRSEGAEARARDAQTASQKTAQAQRESTARMDEREMSLREQAQRSIEADRTQRAQRLEADSAALQQHRQDRLALDRDLADGRITEMQYRAERSRLDADLIRQRNDPASGMSQRARQAVEQQVELRSQARRGEELNPTHLDGLAAVEAERVGRGVDSITTPRLPGRRGGGGNGGGARTEPQGLTDIPAGWAGTPEAWLALPRSERIDIISDLGTPSAAQQRAQAQGDSHGVEIVPGVYATVSTVNAAEARRMRDGIETAQTQSANLRGLGAIHEEYGGLGSRISPQAQQRIRPRLVTARGMVAELGRTGVINPGEVPTINAALPNPDSLTQLTFGTFNAALQEWQQMLEESIRAKLGTRGVAPDQIERVISSIRTGSWSQGGGQGAPRSQSGQQAAPQGDTVRVVSPDGRTGTIPRARLAAALERGYREAP